MHLTNYGELYYLIDIMKIDEIKQVLQNKLNELISRKNLAYMSGDLSTYANIDAQISETEEALTKLNSIQ